MPTDSEGGKPLVAFFVFGFHESGGGCRDLPNREVGGWSGRRYGVGAAVTPGKKKAQDLHCDRRPPSTVSWTEQQPVIQNLGSIGQTELGGGPPSAGRRLLSQRRMCYVQPAMDLLTFGAKSAVAT
jgi:hypothetical protein